MHIITNTLLLAAVAGNAASNILFDKAFKSVRKNVDASAVAATSESTELRGRDLVTSGTGYVAISIYADSDCGGILYGLTGTLLLNIVYMFYDVYFWGVLEMKILNVVRHYELKYWCVHF